MTTPAFTARNLAKYAVKYVVHAKTAQLTEQAIIDHTQFEEDNMIVEIGSHAVGWYVSDKLKPVTDKMIDKTADFITEKRTKRQAKKNAKQD